MSTEISFVTCQKIDNNMVINIAKDINYAVGRKILGNDKSKPIANVYKDGVEFVADYTIDGKLTSQEMHSISAHLSSKYDDFNIEFDEELIEDINEDFMQPTYVNLFDDEAFHHARWIERKKSEGWKYGNTFNESEKVNPYLRPYYTLTDDDKELFKKSREILGYYGLAYPVLFSGRIGYEDDNESDYDSLDIDLG